MRIGLIQPDVIPGDFPKNLRSIIEAYRACIDDDAQLVIAPAMSLSGPHPGELLAHSAYIREHESALQYMSREIANIPLIMGSISGLSSDYQPICNRYLLTHDHIKCLSSSESIVSIQNHQILIEHSETIPLRSSEDNIVDLILCLPSNPWQIERSNNWLSVAPEAARSWHAPTIVVQHAGGSGEFVFPGNSMVWSSLGHWVGGLPLFTAADRVFDTCRQALPPALPTLRSQILLAIQTSIRSLLIKGGFERVLLLKEDVPGCHLLIQLVKQITGEVPQMVQPSNQPTPLEIATSQNSLLLSPCSKNQRLFENVPSAHYAPCADLWDSELIQLVDPKVTNWSEKDRILNLLVDKHRSGTDLIADGFPELLVRQLQRQLERSRWLRHTNIPWFHMHGTTLPSPLLHRFSD